MRADKPKKGLKTSVENADESKQISYFQILRYGKWYEVLATVSGIVCGLLSSFGVCYNLAQFGELSTAFVERTAFQEQLSSKMPLLSLFGGGRRLHNASHEENMLALMEDGAAMGIGMAISIAVSIVLCTLSVALINWSAMRQISRIRSLFLQSVLRQDMSWYDTDTSFNLASRMSDDMLKLKEGISEKLAVVSNLLGTAIICFCQAFPMGWELALACFAVVPLSVASSTILTNYQTQSSKREMDSYSQAGKVAEEVLKSIRTVVAFGGEQREVRRYQRYLEPAEKYGSKRGLYTGLGTGFNWVLTYSLNAIGLAYGARLVLNDLTKPTDDRTYIVGDIFSILFSVYMGTQSITFCIPHGEAFSGAKAAASGIFKLIDRTPIIDSLSTAGTSPKKIAGSITLENVNFCYPARCDVKILKNFSIHIKAGESVALVGSSGCGKSTILQLIQRLYDPESGVVKIDGKDLKTLNLGWLRSSLGVVGQEPVLFRGTILENIAIADPDATKEDIHRVAEMAYAHDFITRLPNGYDTLIGERGASLSGGQKQRIAIARSLLREPVVLLLDEATSALDPHSERKVQAALDRAAAGRTTLTVSHRLSTIVNADRIVCMDQGAIVEEGTYDELMKRKSFFYKLVTTNHDTKDPDVIETLPEEDDNASVDDLPSPTSESGPGRNDVMRRSTRRVQRVHSVHKRNSIDFMPPRGSISSVMSLSLQKGFLYESEDHLETSSDNEEVKPVSWLDLLKLNAPEWKQILIGSIAAFIQGACFPAFSVLFGHTLGIFSLPDRDEIIRQSILFSVLFLVVATVAGVTMCLQSATFTSAGLKMTTRLRLQYFDSLLRQEMGYHDRECNTVGAQCARLSGDAAEVQGATGLQIGLVLQGVSSVVIGFILGASYNWKLTLVGTVFLPLMVGSIWLEGIISQKSAEHERSSMEAATSIATEAVVSIRTVQSLGVEKVFMAKFEEAVSSGTVMLAKKSRWRGLVLGMGIYVPFLLYICATIYGISLIAYEGETYEVILLVTQAIMYGAYMLGQSLVYAPNFNSAKSCGARIIATINRVSKIQTEDTAKDKKDWVATGEIGFKDIEFSYPTRPHQKVIKGISLKVDPGKTVAFVGASGCGKSTMLQLMQRFYDPDSGTIELDSHDIRRALTLPRLRQQLGVVQQEPVLLERSLAENIAYGDNSRKVSMQEVVEAARAANIHSFIVSLPKGYETRVGGGTQLSGGQKQRVCIARALVRAPRLLLLDEATSALDAGSERQVAEALLTAAKGRTCATIAHRLSTVRHADLICVLDQGRIVEKGTHEELTAMQGHYWKLSKGQQLA